LKEAFLRPPDSSRPGVYWYFMDGNLSKTGMTEDLESMKKVGIGNVIFLEVNVGVPQGPVDYLSPQWQELFKHAVNECERLGIRMTLGIGPGWTGSGGPWVAADQSMQHLVSSVIQVSGPQKNKIKLPLPQPKRPYFGEESFTPELKKRWNDFYKDVAVLAFPTPVQNGRIENIDEKALYYREPFSSKPGVKPFLPSLSDYADSSAADIPKGQIVDLTDKLQPDGTLNWVAPEGNWTIMRFGSRNNGAVTRPAPIQGLGFESDKFDTVAINSHLDAYVGKILRYSGLPHKTSSGGLKMLHMDSWEMGAQNWTLQFRQEFIKRRGYDPLPFYPVYAGDIVESQEASERFLWDLRQTSQELVVANHAEQVKKYAHRHGLGLSIEPYDLNPTADLELGRVADIPMGEFWSKGYGYNTAFSIIEAVSLAHVKGIPVVQAEAFTAEGNEAWKQYPGSMKNQGDWAFAAGINRFFYHTFAHKPLADSLRPGMNMGPYGVHWDRMQTWWPMADAYHRYITRCQFMLEQGKPVADILYLTPEGAPHVFLPPSSAMEGDPVIPDRKGYNFDGCSPGQLYLAYVKNNRIVFPGGAVYRLLVLPAVETMTPGLLEKIKSLVAAGAIVVGSPPKKSPSLSGFPQCDQKVQEIARELWGSTEVPEAMSERVYGKGKMIWGGRLAIQNKETLYPDYELTAGLLHEMGMKKDFESGASLRYTHRITKDKDIYFVSNRTDEPAKADCIFNTNRGTPELWDPLTGKTRVLPEFAINEGRTTVPLQLDAYQSFFVVFAENATNHAHAGKNFPAVSKVAALNGTWMVSFDPKWGGPEQVPFDSLTDWSSNADKGIKYYSGIAVYRKTFDLPTAGTGAKRLYIDLGKVKNMARVRLNGHDLGVVWTAPWKVEITGIAKQKNNRLEISVANLWPNRLIGDDQLPDGPRYTFTTYDPYNKDSPLLESGLMGPVIIESEGMGAFPVAVEKGSQVKPAPSAKVYADGRPSAKYRLDAKDQGVVLKYGAGPDSSDYLGARDVFVFEDHGTYYMHYDGAGLKGWLACLATSRDLVNWKVKGPVLDYGKPGSDDSRSASYGSVYFDGVKWHMFYLGTPHVSSAPDYIPAFPYLTEAAESNSPRGPWKKRYDIMPLRTVPGTYYAASVSPGNIIKQGREYLMLFSAQIDQPVTKRTLSYAHTTNLDSAWVPDAAPFLPQEEQVENSAAYYEPTNKTWFVFTNHVGIRNGLEYTDAIWVYWTKDLNKWSPENKAIVLDSVNCHWSKYIIGLPSVVKRGNRLAIFYDGNGAAEMPAGNNSHMRRDVGLAWLELPLRTPR